MGILLKHRVYNSLSLGFCASSKGRCCQFQAFHCCYSDTEEIYKLTGTCLKSITRKMINKLFKYRPDWKQFSLMPAKTMPLSQM